MATTYANLVNKSGTVYNTQTGTGYARPEDLATDLGVSASQIDWGKIASDASYQPGLKFGGGAPVINNAPPTSGDVSLGTNQSPSLPPATSPAVNESYINTLTQTLDSSRKALEDSYNKQLADIKAQQEASQKKIDEFNATQKNIIETQVQPLQTPFRADLEKQKSEELYINQNFEANQKLTNELDALLTEGNELIKEQKNTTGLDVIRTPRINQTISDVNARAGVIKAVMEARNNQITVAQNMIDRTVGAITADRKDQLNYYSTLLSFYEGQKDTEGNKFINLTKDEQTYINSKIKLLENDLTQAQTVANYVKELMVSPDSAQLVADAGITLNDSIATINKKLAAQTVKNTQLAEQKERVKTAQAAGIAKQFYNNAGTIIRTSDGYAFTSPADFKQKTGLTVDQALAQGLVQDYKAPASASNTEIITANGHKMLINSLTGEVIKDYGSGSDDSSNNISQKDAISQITSTWKSGYIQGNGKISSTDYKKAKEWWVLNGLNAATFDTQFNDYIDKSGSNWKEDYGYSTY